MSPTSATVLVNTKQLLGRIDRRIYGQFIEHLGRCIYGGIWVGDDSPIPNVSGYRKDVLEAIRALRPPLVRWPGGNFSSGYHWLDGVGERRVRPIKLDMAWGSDDPNQFGTDEFMEWCRLLFAEPLIVVNAGNGMPEEAAGWVEYANGGGKSKYAAMRRENGHQDSFNVKLWGIGNELYGEWQIGYCVDGRECARRTVEFANEMKKVDPNIRIVAVGDLEQRSIEPEWNLEMIKGAGKYIDYLSVHTYIGGDRDYMGLLSAPAQIERALRATYELVWSASRKYASGKDIKLAFDEWNVWYPEAKPVLLDQVTSVKDGLFTALIFNSLLRLPHEVPIACFAQTVNVLPLISTGDDGAIYVNPQYLAFKMYGDNTGEFSVGTSVDAPCHHSKDPDVNLPILDASATLSEDGKTLYVYIVNKNHKEAIECTVTLRDFTPTMLEHIYMCGEGIDSRNNFDAPDNVVIEREPPVKIISSPIKVALPPHSANIVVLR